jgi:hypothetical protein
MLDIRGMECDRVSEMGWQSDWLYRLIFRSAEESWTQVTRTRETHPNFGPFPEYLLLWQFSEVQIQPYDGASAKLLRATLSGEVTRQWRIDTDGLRLQKEREVPLRRREPVRRVFHEVGFVGFYIHPNRKLVVLSHSLGPLWGRQGVYQVYGQGGRGTLVPHSDFVSFIS